jgi:hypothetical protein
VKVGYYVRLFYVPEWLGELVYLEGRVLWIDESGFLLSGEDSEFVKWDELFAYRLGRYG